MSLASVRRATPADSVAIARVHVDSWREAYPSLLPAETLAALTYEERERQWDSWLARPEIDIFVAERGGALIGFAAGGPARDDPARTPGELHAMYLLARHHGLGIGRALFEAVRDSLVRRHLMPMYLWAIEGNPACGFYERMGGRGVVRQPTEVRGAHVIELGYVFD